MPAATGLVYAPRRVASVSLGTTTPLDTTPYDNIIGLCLRWRRNRLGVTGGMWNSISVNGVVVGGAWTEGAAVMEIGWLFCPPHILDGSEDIGLGGFTELLESRLIYLE